MLGKPGTGFVVVVVRRGFVVGHPTGDVLGVGEQTAQPGADDVGIVATAAGEGHPPDAREPVTASAASPRILWIDCRVWTGRLLGRPAGPRLAW